MSRFFHWHGRGDHWQGDRWRGRHWRGREEPDQPAPPATSGPSFSPLDLLNPLKIFGIGEIGENEDEFEPADEGAEAHHYRRRRWAPYRSTENSGGFFPNGEDLGTRRRTGRWFRRNGRIVLLGV